MRNSDILPAKTDEWFAIVETGRKDEAGLPIVVQAPVIAWRVDEMNVSHPVSFIGGQVHAIRRNIGAPEYDYIYDVIHRRRFDSLGQWVDWRATLTDKAAGA